MRIDHRELGRHYASLTDEDLLSMNREELTVTARTLYDDEVARRGLEEKIAAVEAIDKSPWNLTGINDLLDGEHVEPEWLENAACVCSYVISHGSDSVEKASLAQTVLQRAGIPSHLVKCKETPDDDSAPERDIVNVMAPMGLSLHAISILDRDLFNEEHEAEWRHHLKAFSDEDLLALDPELCCAGILDRTARMKRACAEEIARRVLEDSELQNHS
jgi:hypothetical protein